MLEALWDLVRSLQAANRLPTEPERDRLRGLVHEAVSACDARGLGGGGTRLYTVYLKYGDAETERRVLGRPDRLLDYKLTDALKEMLENINSIRKLKPIAAMPCDSGSSIESPSTSDSDQVICIDEANFTVRQGSGEPMLMRNTIPFRLLVHLYARRHQAVTHEELRSAIWQRQRIETNTIHQSVSQLRKELKRGGIDAIEIGRPARGHYQLNISEKYKAELRQP